MFELVLVSPDLVYYHLRSQKLRVAFELLDKDAEIQSLLKMSNTMAVSRLHYNDHGLVHSRIVSGSVLEIFGILEGNTIPTIVKDGVGELEDAKLVSMYGAYLHDLGNAVHRSEHNIHGVSIANPILTRIIPQVYPNDMEMSTKIRSEILHTIYAHQEGIRCLSVEAGIAKVADGTDMAQGRARIPYRIGRASMHAISAMAIKSVELERGETAPIKIIVNMVNPAGVFQIEEVLKEKIVTSGIEDRVEVLAIVGGEIFHTFRY